MSAVVRQIGLVHEEDVPFEASTRESCATPKTCPSSSSFRLCFCPSMNPCNMHLSLTWINTLITSSKISSNDRLVRSNIAVFVDKYLLSNFQVMKKRKKKGEHSKYIKEKMEYQLNLRGSHLKIMRRVEYGTGTTCRTYKSVPVVVLQLQLPYLCRTYKSIVVLQQPCLQNLQECSGTAVALCRTYKGSGTAVARPVQNQQGQWYCSRPVQNLCMVLVGAVVPGQQVSARQGQRDRRL